jgi:hypothetical protein
MKSVATDKKTIESLSVVEWPLLADGVKKVFLARGRKSFRAADAFRTRRGKKPIVSHKSDHDPASSVALNHGGPLCSTGNFFVRKKVSRRLSVRASTRDLSFRCDRQEPGRRRRVRLDLTRRAHQDWLKQHSGGHRAE